MGSEVFPLFPCGTISFLELSQVKPSRIKLNLLDLIDKATITTDHSTRTYAKSPGGRLRSINLEFRITPPHLYHYIFICFIYMYLQLVKQALVKPLKQIYYELSLKLLISMN